ncbi:MAG TPA: hypothetical protein VGL53_11080 [Bryobacteraceae bacterium]|jgi:hypothetical protein
MAVEETEYFPLTQSNGMSPVVRAAAKGTTKKAVKQVKTNNGSRLVPFFQGITVGAVLLVPLGVWCWVRADTVVENAPAIVEHAPAKSNAATAWKRRPVKAHAAVASTPAVVRPVAQAAPAVDADPPPVVLSPAPSHADEQEHVIETSKKGVWKTVTAPFRGKIKGQTITGIDPSPEQK